MLYSYRGWKYMRCSIAKKVFFHHFFMNMMFTELDCRFGWSLQVCNCSYFKSAKNSSDIVVMLALHVFSWTAYFLTAF